MKTIPLIALTALALTATVAWSANNQGGAGSYNQLPTAATTGPMNTTKPSPNAGSTPAPGLQTGNSANTDASATRDSGSFNNQPGFNNPATEAQRSTAMEITFEPGQSALSAATKQKIDEHLRSARQRGQITRINVIGWGDVAYPAENQSVTDQEKQLAVKRGAEIKSYIDSRNINLNTAAVNMTERPSALQELLNGADARTKDMLEATGVAGSPGRGSRAVVMVITR